MARLTARERASLPDRAFAYVDSTGHRRLPIHDPAHVRNALARFDRVNLCVGKWSVKKAREKVVDILWMIDRPAMVLCGKKVCEAFHLEFKPFTWQAPLPVDDSRRFPNIVILPHPSGLSRAWNESGAYERARAVLREAGVL